jgi:antitoxin (DNA-binding transcriptional repressor) of toxin-antitoxin stability system
VVRGGNRAGVRGQASLSRLVRRVLDGKTIAIGRRGEPEVVLSRFVAKRSSPRQLGGYQGPYRMADDSEDSAEVISLFGGDG